MIDPIKVLRQRQKNSPIETFIVKKVLYEKSKTLYEATVFLKEWDCVKTPNQIYNNASGTGSSWYPFFACLKAASEAIERATYNELKGSSKYGMNVVQSTSGFASYPGITTKEVQTLATNEAIERWSIIEWWNLNLEHTIINRTNNQKTIVINNPFEKWVIIKTKKFFIQANEYTTYGFGCSDKKTDAIFKAQVELERNVRAVKLSLKITPKSLHDKRLVFFSKKEGSALFKLRLKNLVHPTINKMPKTITNEEVLGSFQRYAKTWRTLYENSTYDFLDSTKLDFFYF